LTDGAELDSVYNHGSKKQNLNHLLNFHKYNKETASVRNSNAFSKHGYMHRPYSKRYIYNKEQYLQANCQFVVKKDIKYDYNQFKITPDSLVEWDQVVKVLISSTEESQCPICLYPPRAAKMTKCGHIYCFSCMLHYLSLSDKKWRKCPICYESVHLTDLKSTTSKHDHQSYKIGDLITLELMSRKKGTLFANKPGDEHSIFEFPNYSDVEKTFTYSKLIMANKHEILNIIQHELNELDFQLAVDGCDCPESIFVQQAIDMLKIKENQMKKLIDDEHLSADECVNTESSKNLAQSADENAHGLILENFDNEAYNALIDEDCNLTVGDIDIVPVQSSIQSDCFYYYQAPNAQNVFLHSINSRMLQQMYGSLEKSPQNIRGKIIQIDCCTMNEDLRKRLKYLQHLPVSSVFEIVEIEFEPDTLISKETFGLFKGNLKCIKFDQVLI
jgi:Zinc finger, C3HC4 type (RING finger)